MPSANGGDFPAPLMWFFIQQGILALEAVETQSESGAPMASLAMKRRNFLWTGWTFPQPRPVARLFIILRVGCSILRAPTALPGHSRPPRLMTKDRQVLNRRLL